MCILVTTINTHQGSKWEGCVDLHCNEGRTAHVFFRLEQQAFGIVSSDSDCLYLSNTRSKHFHMRPSLEQPIWKLRKDFVSGFNFERGVQRQESMRVLSRFP